MVKNCIMKSYKPNNILEVVLSHLDVVDTMYYCICGLWEPMN